MENNCPFINTLAKIIKVISWILFLGGINLLFGGFIYLVLGIFIDEPFYRIENNISIIEYLFYSILMFALGYDGAKDDLEPAKN
jgi:uncharacterized protein YqhQ